MLNLLQYLLQQMRKWLQPYQRHTKRMPSYPLNPSFPLSIHPQSVCLLAWNLVSVLKFLLILIIFFIHFVFRFYLSLLSLNACLSLWLSGILPPSLYLSLSIAGSMYRSPMSVCLSVHACVCLSVRQAEVPHGGGECGDPHFLRGWWSWVSPCVGLPISVKPCGWGPGAIPPFCGCLTWVRMSRIFLWANCRTEDREVSLEISESNRTTTLLIN